MGRVGEWVGILRTFKVSNLLCDLITSCAGMQLSIRALSATATSAVKPGVSLSSSSLRVRPASAVSGRAGSEFRDPTTEQIRGTHFAFSRKELSSSTS